MGREGVLTPELAERLAPAAGLRNRLVHEYDELDDQVVLGAVAEARWEFAAYAARIGRFLQRVP